MLRIVMIGRSIIIIAASAGVGMIAASKQDWQTAIWCLIAAIMAAELLSHERIHPLPASDPCAVCGRHRIGGGVFVAGVGPICFECEERRFGSTDFGDSDG